MITELLNQYKHSKKELVKKSHQIIDSLGNYTIREKHIIVTKLYYSFLDFLKANNLDVIEIERKRK